MVDTDSDNPDPDLLDKPTNPMETAERRARVVDMHHGGSTFQQIGDALGVTRQRAHEIYWDAIAAVPARAVGALRSSMAEKLVEVERVASKIMATDRPAHSNGRVVTMLNDVGEEVPVIDDSLKLDAGRTIIAAQGRMAKMLGIDAPTKVEADVSGQVDVAAIPLVGLIEAARLAVEAEETVLKGGSG